MDHCVPVEVARSLAHEGHQAWTAYGAGLADALDDEIVAYAYVRGAVLVTTNRDCAQLARRVASASVVWLAVRETDARSAMARALAWLDDNRLPTGRVLRVRKTAEPVVLAPLPL